MNKLLQGSTLVALMFGVALNATAAPPSMKAIQQKYSKDWQKKPAPAYVQHTDRVLDDSTLSAPITVRVHKSSDSWLIVAKTITAKEEKDLLARGYKKVTKASQIRPKTIFNHEVYVSYAVGPGGPTDAEIVALKGKVVQARFKNVKQLGTPMLVELTAP